MYSCQFKALKEAHRCCMFFFCSSFDVLVIVVVVVFPLGFFWISDNFVCVWVLQQLRLSKSSYKAGGFNADILGCICPVVNGISWNLFSAHAFNLWIQQNPLVSCFHGHVWLSLRKKFYQHCIFSSSFSMIHIRFSFTLLKLYVSCQTWECIDLNFIICLMYFQITGLMLRNHHLKDLVTVKLNWRQDTPAERPLRVLA